MRSLLLVLAVAVCSNPLVAKVPKTAKQLLKVKEAVTVLESVMAATELARFLETADINAIAQVLLDQGSPDTGLLLHYSDGILNSYDLSKALDQQGKDYHLSTDGLLLNSGVREKAIGQLLGDDSGIGIVIHKHEIEEKSLAYISQYELGEGGVISEMLDKQLRIEDGAIVVTDFSSSLSMDGASAIGLDQVVPEEVGITPLLIIHHNAAADKYDIAIAEIDEVLKGELSDLSRATFENAMKNLQDDRDEQYVAAADALIHAIEAEQLVWPEARDLGWQDFDAYIDGMRSSRVLIKEKIGDEEELLEKIKQYLAGETVLNAAEFKILCQYTKELSCGYRTGEGLTLEAMLAVERVLAVHAENVAELGGDSYLAKLAISQELNTDLIRRASNVYQQGELQLQLVEYPLPKEVGTSDKDIQQAEQLEQVQEILAMLNTTKHILYTDTFVSWLKGLKTIKLGKIKFDELAKVKKRLKLWTRLPSREILRITVGKEFKDAIAGDIEKNPNDEVRQDTEIIEDKWDFVAKGYKLRLYYAKHGDQVVLLNGSTRYDEGKANNPDIKTRDKDPQAKAINIAANILKELKRLNAEIANSVEAKQAIQKVP